MSSRFSKLELGSGRRRVIALVAPFILLPLGLRLAVGPVGDALASAIANAAPAPVVAEAAEPEDEGLLFVEHRGPASKEAPRRVARWAPPPASSAKRDGGAPLKGGTIVVGATTIAKALEDKKVRTRDVVDPDGKPFGVKIRGVSQYKTGLQDGDIIIEVGGVRVHSTTELTQEGLKQAGSATKLTGKILRGETTYDVVLELPQKS